MKKKRAEPLHLDMSFDEALKRFSQTDQREISAQKTETAKGKKRKRSSRSNSKTSASPGAPI
jgi:hypothetical protein